MTPSDSINGVEDRDNLIKGMFGKERKDEADGKKGREEGKSGKKKNKRRKMEAEKGNDEIRLI